MNHGAETGKFVSLHRLSKKTAKHVKALKRIYLELCSSGANDQVTGFFADNFHVILSAAGSKGEPKVPFRQIYFNGRFELADAVISVSDDRFPDTDMIIYAIRAACSERRIYGCELEYLRFSLVYTLVGLILQCLKSHDKNMIRYMSLLGDIGSIDLETVNGLLNPVAEALKDDAGYCESDPKTRLFYREAIYRTASRYSLDEIKLTRELREKYSDEPIDLQSLSVVKKSRLSAKSALIPFFGLMAASAALSAFIAISAGAPLCALLLFLPTTEALRPFSDHILTKKHPARRLMRLRPDSERVKSERIAIVLSAAISDPDNALGLYDRLLRLHCLNPSENITVCALCDLPAEQVPVTSEDKAVIEALSETVTKLNASGGKFCCIVRKRSFSETQQEYMGRMRKRGALYELSKFMKTGESDFYAALGDADSLKGIDYICAVDSDTLPQMDSVNELAAIALHPANKVTVKNGHVTRGFGIICPRTVTGLRDSLRSEFSKSLGGIGSRSSYDEESHELWQDVFSRGTFGGKGLINVTALYECTKDLDSERILSHDILEGEILKTAYAGDIVFTEGFPRSPQSYYRRLDRWIRGDFQNIPEIFSKSYDAAAKLKLSDNLRRAAIPPIVLTAFFCGFFLEPAAAVTVALSALAMWLFPPALGTVYALISDRFPGRKYYSGLLSSASQSLRYILYSTVMLPTLAVKSLRAIVTALVRLMTRRHLLDWTTADAMDRTGENPLSFYLLPELAGLSLLWSGDYVIRLFGVIFSLMPVLLLLDDVSGESETAALRYRDIRELSKHTADMWGFFESAVTRADNWLPPDNIQFSPVYRVAHRTSPTNIGLYLLSVLAAYDRKLINQTALLQRCAKTLSAVERLEKYCGNLYNWYDTRTLKILPKPYVSSVDSGNFVCCLVALKEGLKELEGVAEAKSLEARLEKIINQTDLSVFYNPVRGLMAIGIDPQEGRGRAHYDFLMSEARLTSFWAIASRQIPKSHWQRLSRAMLSCGFFGGAASYSGTMFEYFMPEIFLKSPEGSLFSESLRYALYVQRRYAKSLGRPYGISESGCYSFDNALNYRYSAHGVPNTGMKRGLEQNYVISPYSTYLSLCFSGGDGVDNLRKIADYGMYGSFGLYEALDFSSSGSEKPEPVRSYMSHHMGMSILSCDNILNGGIMQKRFMRDLRVKGALELLEERFHLGAAVFENSIRRPAHRTPDISESEKEVMTDFSLTRPRVKLLSNGELTLLASDSGDCSLVYRSKNVYLRTRDLISRPKGSFYFVSDGGDAVSLSYLTDRKSGLICEFNDDSATYYVSTEKLSAGMKIRLHETLPCELRTFALKNLSSSPLDVSLICYIEPSLQDTAAEEAHPAFSKMFLRLEREMDLDCVTVNRVREDRQIYIAVGFIEEVKKTVSFNREDVLSRPDGIYSLGKRFKNIPPSLISEPDPCVYVRASLELPPKSEAELSMFIICADSKEELTNRISLIRRKRLRSSSSPRLDTAPGRVASAILPKILYGGKMSAVSTQAVLSNRLPLNALWELSVPTDIPLVLIELNGKNDSQKLSSYLGAYKLLRLCGVAFQLIFSFDDGGRYEREHFNELTLAARQLGLESFIYSGGGIMPLDLSKLREGMYELVKAAACHICTDGIVPQEKPPATLKYITVEQSQAIKQAVDWPVACGGFSGENYVINEKPPLPWCHVLSNPVFGTLLSEGSLGMSYAFNSRENRLTPWDNDAARDNIGERLLLNLNGEVYDLIRGAAAVFGPYFAEYRSKGDGYECHVRVGVSKTGMCKKISVKINLSGEGKICYYTEPCMGVTREHSRLIIPKRTESGLMFYSPAAGLPGYMSVSASEDPVCQTDREDFWTGRWTERVEPSEGLCGAVIVNISEKNRLDFYLSYALNEAAAEKMPALYEEQTDTRQRQNKLITKDRATGLMANTWLRYQALHGRIWARTGFSQCSGAYGFRDQLQDACGIVRENPDVLKAQILRCCGAQFIEGDVMHWWHDLPGQKTKGIRTRISDDPLWLAYALCEYLKNTDDADILSLCAPYCDGLELGEGEQERYGEVYKTALRESVYRHCVRAVEHSAGRIGKHGLMLFGSGDWNDGFGNVGKGGEGESVWLSEFYIMVLRRFSKVAQRLGDAEYSNTLTNRAEALASATEFSARSGGWYLRGFFDDGSPLGAKKNQSCRIDSIAQSFAEFAGLGQSDGFAKDALKRAYDELCDIRRGVIKLFTPAFSENSEPDPGYIKFYPEGMRENGGQYTHGAVWLGMACRLAGLETESREIFRALNPIVRSMDGGYEIYKTEPYYLCGDVYANKNCRGRGGWSIYTGSAAWYYRALREAKATDDER